MVHCNLHVVLIQEFQQIGIVMSQKLPADSFQRILVVDDDPAILQLVSDKLDLAGFEVLTAAGGQEALVPIKRRGIPHLAIVDIN